jgi:RNA-binding protein
MSELTGKQKRHLRAIGQRLKPICTVSEEGLAEGGRTILSNGLAKHELVKVKMPAGPGPWRKQLAELLASETNSQCVGVVGRTALLFRPNPDCDAPIDLP